MLTPITSYQVESMDSGNASLRPPKVRVLLAMCRFLQEVRKKHKIENRGL